MDTASPSCSAELTCTTLTPAGSTRPAVCPAIRVTSAPRWAATRATRIALLAGAAVADETHRVDRLAGAAGGHQHPAAREVVGQRVVALQQQLGQRGDLLGLGQPAGAAVRAGEPSGGGFEHDRAAAAQRGDVVHGGRVQPHLGVHRRREQHRTSRGEQRGGQQIVGPAVHGAGQQVSGGGRDHDQVGLLAERDVRHLGDVVEDAGVHRLAGERLEGGGPDEMQRGLGGDDTDLMAGLGELADDGARLVGGDTAGDADDDPLAVLSCPSLGPPGPLLALGVLEQVGVDLAHRDR